MPTASFSYRLIALAIVGSWLLVAAPAGAAEQRIGALGRLVPGGGVVGVTARQAGVIGAWHVAPEQQVVAGQLLASLALADALQAALQDAEQEAQALARLLRARLELQQALVELERLRLVAAKADLDGYRSLGDQATSSRELARRQSAVAEAEARLQAERLRIGTTEAQGELDRVRATANVNRTRVALDQARILAPSAGTVLGLDRRLGETVGSEPVLRLADLSVMHAECEVYAGDLVRVQPGQAAEIRNEALGLALAGRVIAVSRLVDGDRNLGTVTVRIDDPATASRLIGLEVQVNIVTAP